MAFTKDVLTLFKAPDDSTSVSVNVSTPFLTCSVAGAVKEAPSEGRRAVLETMKPPNPLEAAILVDLLRPDRS